MWKDDAYLLDILLAAREAQDFSSALTREGFGGSKLHQFATVRALEIVGEAAAKVSPELQQAPPEIPWAKMIRIRNRLIHDYTRVNLDIVWEVVHKEVPKLIRCVEPLVPPKEGSK